MTTRNIFYCIIHNTKQSIYLLWKQREREREKRKVYKCTQSVFIYKIL